jgi:alcohol dehydrogenase class IV
MGIGNYQNSPLPVIAIPTTAGSGSEVSQVFIISDEKTDNKMTISGPEVFPETAILDPLLLRSLPPWQFILSGLDALGHAIEATSTTQANFMTDAMAYEAIEIIMANLAPAALTDNLEAKRDQLIASSMANIACGNAKLGLGHSVSSALGLHHVPHGLAVGILIPYVMEFNLPACEKQTAKMAAAMGVASEDMTQAEMAWAALDAVRDLYDILEFPDRLTEDMVPKEKIPELVENAIVRPTTKMNLRKSSAEDLTKIYEAAYRGWRNLD